MKNIAVILAAGSGSRFGAGKPKQFIKLAGKPLIAYTIAAFQKAACIDEIILVTHLDYMDSVHELVTQYEFSKVAKVLSGGKERYDSSWAAIQSMGEEECQLIFHDAVRPFVSERIIQECVQALEKWNAVDVVVDPTDTIVKMRGDKIMSIPNRRQLGRGQTPQAFKKSVIEKAYVKFMADPDRLASDDCGIVLKYLPTEPVHVVKGEEQNFKITHQQDLYLADNFIRDGLLNQNQTDEWFLEQQLADKVVVVFGGSSGIGEALVAQCRDFGANVYSFSRRHGCDITQPAEVRLALDQVYQAEKRIDFIVNTAAVLIKKPLAFLTDEEVLANCQVNYLGAVHVARAGYEYLKTSRGMLINFTSSSYTRGRSGYSLYSSSKAAVVNLTQALSEEWLNAGVRVNCINPERTNTPMRRQNFGIEPVETLLSADFVAKSTLSVMVSDYTGQILLIKK